MIRIGVISAESRPPFETYVNPIQLAIEDATLDDDVELVERRCVGAPTGSPLDAVKGFRALAEESVVGIIGPGFSDNVLTIVPVADEVGVPTMLTGAHSGNASEWCFNLSFGAALQTSTLVMQWIRGQGYSRIGIISDDSFHMREEVDNELRIAARHGVRVAGVERTIMSYADPERQLRRSVEAVARLQEAQPEAVVASCSSSLAPVAQAFQELGWDVPCVATGAFTSSRVNDDHAAWFEGWVGCAQWHEDNPLWCRFAERYSERFGPMFSPEHALTLYDAARALLEGIALAPIHNRAGVRAGIESIGMLPATSGAPGTFISFGPWDHRGYKGEAWILRRQAGPLLQDQVREVWQRPEA